MATFHLVTNIAGLLRNCTDVKLGRLFDMNGKQARRELMQLQAKGDKYLPSENCKHFDPQKGCMCGEFENEIKKSSNAGAIISNKNKIILKCYPFVEDSIKRCSLTNTITLN